MCYLKLEACSPSLFRARLRRVPKKNRLLPVLWALCYRTGPWRPHDWPPPGQVSQRKHANSQQTGPGVTTFGFGILGQSAKAVIPSVPLDIKMHESV